MFYLHMRFDNHHYAEQRQSEALPFQVFNTSSLMINESSGFDMQYQINKVHNLKLAAQTLNHLLIKPGETFSFWQLVRYADRAVPYKDGLSFSDGKITGSYGGGLCQISNLLFWMFLHTPLTIAERHGHTVEMFPSTTEALPCGTDATIIEGWRDLKVKNETGYTFQLALSFDHQYMHGCVLSDEPPTEDYQIFNQEVSYYQEGGKAYRHASVNCTKTDRKTMDKNRVKLYDSICEIGYALPDGVQMEEQKGTQR
jgi:vancomycin resistance protein VanW